MLKQVLIFVISSAILIFSGIWEIKYIENSSRYILSDIEYSKNALNNNNFELTKAHVENLEQTWSNTKKVWNMFVVDDAIKDIDNAISTYKIHIEYDNLEDSTADCELLKKMVNDVVKSHKISYENIF